MSDFRARFRIGQPIHHKLFDYRGVVIDVDPIFQGSEDWYEMMALSCPPKDKPWYHVIVHNSVHNTYVAEQNLEPDLSGEQIIHPDLDNYFSDFSEGIYLPIKRSN